MESARSAFHPTDEKLSARAPAYSDSWGWGVIKPPGLSCRSCARPWCGVGVTDFMAPVEVDETYVGGIEHGVRGRGTDTKFIVVIAIEVLSPKGFGRVRLQRVDDVSGASLVPFVTAAVEQDAE